MARKKKLTFEESIEELELIVNQLESGDTPLEESIKLYQNGIEHAQLCHDLLNQAEEKVKQIIVTKEGTINIKEFTNSELEKGEYDERNI